MPAINFMKQFADAVENGDKRQTIRPERKRPICAGDTLYLYTGQRTRQARKLKEVECSQVSDIEVANYYVLLNGKCLAPLDADSFAQRDGFNNRHELIAFFKRQYGLPFNGVLIEW